MFDTPIITPAGWAGINFANPKDRRKVFGAIQHFINRKHNASVRGGGGDLTRALQEITAQAKNFGADNFPDAILPILDKYREGPETESSWTNFFKLRDMTSTTKNGFRVVSVAEGLTFAEVPIGEKARLFSFAGESAFVEFVRFGGGLGWDRTLIDDKEFWDLDDIAQAFVLKWFNQRNDSAFALLNSMLSGGAASGSVETIAWAATTPAALPNTDANYQAIRDMNTLTNASIALINKNKTKGYGVTENTTVTLMFPLAMRTRVMRALGILNAGISGSFEQVKFNIKPVMSIDLDTSTEMLMGIPGNKTIFADRQRLTVFDRFDPLSYSDYAVGWGRYAGSISDFDQFVVVATA